VRADGIPEALKRERRWVLWRFVLRENLWTKVPFQAAGAYAKANDPATWTTLEAVLAAYRMGNFDGIGFVLGDGWAGVDIDKCYPSDASTVPAAEPYLGRLAATCYSELSPSETGVKAIGKASRIGGEIKFSTNPPTFTTWTSTRFFAITGAGMGDPTADISTLIEEWFPAAPDVTASSAREGYALAAESSNDDLLIAAIANDAIGDEFLSLWRGDTSAYGNDHSRADLALCCHLAFWTNYDAERIDRMFRQGDLMRPKWDHASYRRATLGKAMR